MSQNIPLEEDERRELSAASRICATAAIGH
jgi:hypothetical protein